MDSTDDSIPSEFSWANFESRLRSLVPDLDLTEATEISALPPYQRIRVLRWVSDFFERPVPLPHLETFSTLGEVHAWMASVLAAGERPSSRSPRPGLGSSSRVTLRPLEDRDILPLYRASFHPEQGLLWRYRGRTLPMDEFVRTVFAGVVTQYVVEMNESGQAIGLVTAYDENAAGLHCKIAFLRFGSRTHGDQAAVFEGMMLFISLLFSSFPFRKLYAEVPAYNMSLFADDFADEEGVLKEYLFHQGRFVDLHLVSISRDRWGDLAMSTGW